MKHKAVTNLITRILEARPETRDSDMELLIHTWYELLPGCFFQDAERGWSVSIDGLKSLHGKIRLESASRLRRKITTVEPKGLGRTDLQAVSQKVRLRRHSKASEVAQTINTSDYESALTSS